MPILVANASEHGTTQQIAEHIAERLAAARHQAEARQARPTREVLAGLSGVAARNAAGVSRKARLLGYCPVRTRAPRSLARSVAVSPEIAAPMTVQSLLREVEG